MPNYTQSEYGVSISWLKEMKEDHKGEIGKLFSIDVAIEAIERMARA